MAGQVKQREICIKRSHFQPEIIRMNGVSVIGLADRDLFGGLIGWLVVGSQAHGE